MPASLFRKLSGLSVVAFALAVFSLPVSAANLAPAISGYPAISIKLGATYYFQPTASDPEKHALTFSIVNKPFWATFDTHSGLLKGQPTTFGNWSNIVIKVSDGQSTVQLPAFAIRAWTAPTITGTPVTKTPVGSGYSFTPVAKDADGSALGFTITNKPAWAVFNTQTGRLSGTPATAGSTANITITVSDGKASATLAPFTLTTTAPRTDRVTLSWYPPTANVDSSALDNLSAYKIYYGSSAAMLNRSVTVPAGVSSYELTGLDAGNWYFAMSAINAVGTESSLSAMLVKTL
jgi:hypothetical protein